MFVYYFRYFALDLLFILVPSIYLFLGLSQDISLYFSIGLRHNIIILTLIQYCADLFTIIRKCIIIDSHKSVNYAFRHRSFRCGKDYMYLEQRCAYLRSSFLDDSIHKICNNELISFEDKQILKCGHIYQIKREHWDNNKFIHLKCKANINIGFHFFHSTLRKIPTSS